jgi:hypothetical protein
MAVEEASGGNEIMGTNYYLHAPKCFHCGKEEEPPLHLGKGSYGWCFGLHVYPEDGINNWQQLWSRIDYLTQEKDYEIRDEYGDFVENGKFFSIVWDRSGKPDRLFDKQWLRDNYAEIGPYGLARHALLAGHCIGHGEGPFDYIIGEFS